VWSRPRSPGAGGIAKNVVLMPSYVNIGAYVDEGTMVDTWATVGSCAQIGRNVHLSGGVGIGGVLEPLQANPTIIEDNCFVGARSEVVEGVIVEENSVLGMGVFIGQSTKIYDRTSGDISYGRVPSGSVVVAGSLPSGTGGCQLYCAVIVKRVDARRDRRRRSTAAASVTAMSVQLKTPRMSQKCASPAGSPRSSSTTSPHVQPGITTASSIASRTTTRSTFST
jgi:2,3,4,5-tetrahydropyridine-2,6-dicarboxylate N-succinyltransferase